MRQHILDRIPDSYADLYPTARQMKRHFVIHCGGTNSGKTYESLKALAAANKGIYLGPLRLLAFECYERLNAQGVPCSLVTGEEELLVPGSFHQASTIEMMDDDTLLFIAGRGRDTSMKRGGEAFQVPSDVEVVEKYLK